MLVYGCVFGRVYNCEVSAVIGAVGVSSTIVWEITSKLLHVRIVQVGVQQANYSRGVTLAYPPGNSALGPFLGYTCEFVEVVGIVGVTCTEDFIAGI